MDYISGRDYKINEVINIMGEIADDMFNGLCCSCCGIYFEEEHGFPVLCESCYEDETKEERTGIQKAYIKEL